MKKTLLNLKRILVLAAGSFLIISCEVEDTPPVFEETIAEEQFDTDINGWTSEGGGITTAMYGFDEGSSDGYIEVVDDHTGGVWYFSAPASYLGEKSIYYGSTIKFCLFQDSEMKYQISRPDVIFKNEDKQIFYNINHYPTKEWTDYAIKLDENSGWRVGDTLSSKTATLQDIQSILANVTDFWIRGEFEHGPDKGGMTKVSIAK